MPEQSALDRAMTLAEMAPHSSVTVGVLAGQEGEFEDARLAERPPVTYLEPSEAPAYVLTNRKRGIGLGTKRNRTTPDDGRGTVVLVTGRRTLCLVGREAGDAVFDIPHRTLSAARYRTGLLAHRIVLESPRSRYHLWIERGTEKAWLDQATAYVTERLPEDPEPAETVDESASTITYRGKPVAVEEVTNGDGTAATNGDAADAADTARQSPADHGTEQGEGGGDSAGSAGRTVTYRGKEYDPSEID